MKRKNIFTIAILSLLVSCSSSKHLALNSNWLDGTWRGIGYQIDQDVDNKWDIELSVNTSNKEYSISYPSIPCKGEWELIEISDERAVFKEIITNNTDCVSGGKVLLSKLDNDRVIYSSYYPKDLYYGDRIANAFATLIKN